MIMHSILSEDIMNNVVSPVPINIDKQTTPAMHSWLMNQFGDLLPGT